jgi:hypothetical protein
LEVLLDRKVTLRPLASGGVRTEDKHADGDSGDEDEGDNERNSPSDVGSQVLVFDEGVEDSWHDEVRNPPSYVTPTACERVCSSDNVLIKESC